MIDLRNGNMVHKKETMNFIITQLKAQIIILKETALQQLNNEIPE